MNGKLSQSRSVTGRPSTSRGAVLQSGFDDLYTAVYAVLDDAKSRHDLVKLYKGSHTSPDPHPVVTDVGSFFYRERQGLFGYACHQAGNHHSPTLADLDVFDAAYQPRISVRAVYELLYPQLARPGESAVEVLRYVAGRRHRLGAYRGGSSGFDEEARAFAAAHFTSVGVPCGPDRVAVFCGGAKGAFMAFCAAIMCRRRHDDLHHLGGLLLTPAGYYQSLRLIPPVFGGTIHVTPELTGTAVSEWLAATADHPRRCVYVPLVNNADGAVLTRERAHDIAGVMLEHNAIHPGRPVYVLADDVYALSWLDPHQPGLPIGAVTGTDLGEPALGPMSDWTLSVATPSKTFALPTSRVAFATTTSPALAAAVAHYRTVLSQGRVPQASELTAAAAICLTPTSWINDWNVEYRSALQAVSLALHQINTRLGHQAVWADPIEGGWYLPLRVSPTLLPSAASSVDAFAALLHYGGADPDSGIALLPGELFGHRDYNGGFLLRGTLAAGDRELHRFVSRLTQAATLYSGPAGPDITVRALRQARTVADLDAILASTRY
ncbi:aminotransferase class I/II-fold pyridoxal phosphate-dependent enzyme [Actinomadura darangshiensis]|uniref:Aminotransferase class I/II-fold pyridoxal phosphate-dependent enzyme n=1 Tax=Actinomadura darangshiensis TaxID=705336 RepID=A0A4R4ZWF4_9ACTN|nr:aminotransferase class I/II-fold pyridoxal phosphate-dependent enzyme [Actinomadura darangshiensis]TDD62594.1 aminotransferase class I/II-fold pyridoxal phosphate-dependent enzyme [Actinomadura darangshiensis]